jgi:hypothetical protein
MMGKIGIRAAGDAALTGQERAPPPQQSELNEEDRSKDAFFVQVAELAEAMIARHGRDFAVGVLVLSAKFIAEGKPLINRANGGRERAGAVKPV